MIRAFTLLSILCLAHAGALSGQGIRGRLLQSDSSTAIVGALVVLEDSAGNRAAQAVSGAGGRYALRVPAVGAYKLRVLRIGYYPFEMPVSLEHIEDLERTLILAGTPVTLPEISVAGKSMCGEFSRGDTLSSALWTEAGTALRIAAQTVKERSLRFVVIREEREINAVGDARPVDAENRLGTSGWPVRSPPLDSLLEYGFILNREDLWEGPTWLGPDPDVLLSNAFFAGHCFQTVPPATGLPAEWVGLAFEPALESTLTDVRGTLWLDRSSGELRRIDYGYTLLPKWAKGRDAGGTLSLARLNDGGWVVQQWLMRVPIPKVERIADTRTADNRTIWKEKAVFYGYRESGGRVTEVRSPTGESIQRFPQ